MIYEELNYEKLISPIDEWKNRIDRTPILVMYMLNKKDAVKFSNYLRGKGYSVSLSSFGGISNQLVIQYSKP